MAEPSSPHYNKLENRTTPEVDIGIMYSWDLLLETCFLQWVPLGNVSIMSQNSPISYHETKHAKHEPVGVISYSSHNSHE